MRSYHSEFLEAIYRENIRNLLMKLIYARPESNDVHVKMVNFY
jgi:hypothetical protein